MQDFTLYKKKSSGGKKGRVFWYVKAFNEAEEKFRTFSIDVLNERLAGEAVHVKSRAEAEKIAIVAQAKGLFAGERKKRATKKSNNPFFADYLLNFWDYDTSEYVAMQGRDNIGRAHCYTMRKMIENHVIPYLPRHLRCSEVSMQDMRRIFIEFVKKGLAGATWKKVLNALRKPVDELRITEVLVNDVMLVLERSKYPKRPKFEKGILTEEETAGVLAYMYREGVVNYRALHRNGKGEYVEERRGMRQAYLITKIASLTAMRPGEILALRLSSFMPIEDPRFEDCMLINVDRAYSRKDGFKCTKTGDVRVVPCTKELYSEVLDYLDSSGASPSLIFSRADNAAQPVDILIINRYFNRAVCVVLGITDEERKGRNITLYSTRHYCNTETVDLLDRESARLITGHKTEAMTSNYYHAKKSTLNERLLALALTTRRFVPTVEETEEILRSEPRP